MNKKSCPLPRRKKATNLVAGAGGKAGGGCRRGDPVEQPVGVRPGGDAVGPGPELGCRSPVRPADVVDAGPRGSVLRRQLVLVAVGEGAVLRSEDGRGRSSRHFGVTSRGHQDILSDLSRSSRHFE